MHTSPDNRPPESSRETSHAEGHEPEAVKFAPVAFAGLGLLALTLLALVITYGLMTRWEISDPQRPSPAGRVELPAGGVVPDQARMRRQLQREELQQLDSYGWVDRERGIARIPIEAAMQWQADQGLSFAAAEQEQAASDGGSGEQTGSGRRREGGADKATNNDGAARDGAARDGAADDDAAARKEEPNDA